MAEATNSTAIALKRRRSSAEYPGALKSHAKNPTTIAHSSTPNALLIAAVVIAPANLQPRRPSAIRTQAAEIAAVRKTRTSACAREEMDPVSPRNRHPATY